MYKRQLCRKGERRNNVLVENKKKLRTKKEVRHSKGEKQEITFSDQNPPGDGENKRGPMLATGDSTLLTGKKKRKRTKGMKDYHLV